MIRVTPTGLNAARVLAQSAVAKSLYAIAGWTASPLAEFTMASFTIPGGTLGPNGALQVELLFSMSNQASSTKTMKAKLGTAAFMAPGIGAAAELQTTNTIRNRGVQNSQVARYPATVSSDTTSSAIFTSSVDTSIDQTFSITGQTALETGFTPTQANMSGSGSVVTVNQAAHGLNTGEYVQAAGSSTAGYNRDPIQVTVVNANQFTYPGTGTGTPTTSPTIKRYSVLQLEAYSVRVFPG